MLKQELEGLLAAPFTQDGFTSLMREILPGWQAVEAPVRINETERNFIVRATSLGAASDGDAGLDLDVLVVELASGHSVHSSRSAQRALLTRLLRQQQREAALAAFYCRDSGSWRVSFVHLTWQHGEDGKVKTEVLAPLRRYSFVVGRGEPVHTATSQLLHLVELQRPPTLDEIEQAFSIERVTKEFYQRIAILFSKLTGGQRRVGGQLVAYEAALHLPSRVSPEELQRFAVRLIGRLLFAWFLTKKHPDKGIPLMPPELLSIESVDRAIHSKQLYYHDVLERVFFEVLNTPVEQRKREYRSTPWSQVPFLSSNLFEARDDDYYQVNPTGQSEFYKSLTVPNAWLHELLDLFSEYNFTIDENLSVDVDLAIEPEMLGRVFENLLAEINPETGETARKATGSYYTPRVIVDFMVDEALCSYLLSQTSLTRDQVTALLSYDGNDVTDLPQELCDEVLNAFDRMTALDPACGSGAFPMGILQKSLLVLSRVDPGSQRWAQHQLDRITDAGLRQQLRDKLQREEREFVHKIGLVRNCIYGIDIQPIAVEMSKLRFLLSLMVDESIDDALPNRGIMPLPNLEFKFACANSLIRSPGEHGGLLADAKDLYFQDLGDMTAQYFDMHDPGRKLGLRKKIEGLVTDKVKKQLELANRRNAGKRYGSALPGHQARESEPAGQAERDAVLWDSYRGIFKGESVGFFELLYFFPDVKDGFSIVIANPPYIRQEDIREQKPALQAQGYEVWNSTSDLYTYFYERAWQLLSPNGVGCYISSNKFMRVKYGERLRGFLTRQSTLELIVDLGRQKVFESATVDTCILKFRKQQPPKQHAALSVPVGSDYALDTPLPAYVLDHGAPISQEKLATEPWTIANDAVLRLKQKIGVHGTPVSDWGARTYRGITTGLNEAFVIDTPTKERLCREDPRTAKVVKPLLRGKGIDRYHTDWLGWWLLYVPWHFPLDHDPGIEGASSVAEVAFRKQYPAVYRHLLQYKSPLEDRNKAETGIRYEWYALQRFASNYVEEFEKPKIVWQRVTQEPTFCLAPSGMYIHDSMAFLTCDEKDISLLLGILNSSVVRFYFAQIAHQYGNTGFLCSNQYVEKLPIIKVSLSERSSIERCVAILTRQPRVSPLSSAATSEAERTINRILYRAVDLSADEIALIESSVDVSA
jgi:hypothetical protein